MAVSSAKPVRRASRRTRNATSMRTATTTQTKVRTFVARLVLLRRTVVVGAKPGPTTLIGQGSMAVHRRVGPARTHLTTAQVSEVDRLLYCLEIRQSSFADKFVNCLRVMPNCLHFIMIASVI